ASDHLCRGNERVVTNPHGRGPGVVLDTVNGQARPGDRDDAFDHADREPFFLEQWSLLDVQLEIGPEGPGHARLGAQVADPLELVDQADAVLVPGVVGVLEGDLAGPLTEDVPHLIHGDREAGLPHPGYHPVAAALVLVREGQTGEPAAGGLPDPAELLDRLLQALLIDVHLRSPEVGAKGPDMRA